VTELFFYDTQLYRQKGPDTRFDRHLDGRWQEARGGLSLSEEEFLHLGRITETEAKWLIAWGGWNGNTPSLRDYVAKIEQAGLRPGMVEPPNGFSMNRRA
jgi:hypothetical protein